MTDTQGHRSDSTRILVSLLVLVLLAPIAAAVLAKWPRGRISELARKIEVITLSFREAAERLAELEVALESLRAEIAAADAETAQLESLHEDTVEDAPAGQTERAAEVIRESSIGSDVIQRE